MAIINKNTSTVIGPSEITCSCNESDYFFDGIVQIYDETGYKMNLPTESVKNHPRLSVKIS